MPQTLKEHLSGEGFSWYDAPFPPIRKEWEQFPICKSIRRWEKIAGRDYNKNDLK